MITKLPQEFLSVISENNGLKVYLSNLSKGRDYTPRSWLYENESPDQVLQNWLDQLSTLENGDTFEKEVFQFDTSQLKKWGPQGGIAPIDDLMASVVEPTFVDADSPRPQAFATPAWEQAKRYVVKTFHANNIAVLRPAAYSNVVADMRARDTLESNSGWPDFTRRNKPEVLAAAVKAAGNEAWMDYPAIALFRNYNLKTRLVWMFPEATNIYEGSFCQPIQSAIINAGLGFYSPWVGFEKVRDLISWAYNDHQYFLTASDFSATDAHFQLSTTLEVFDVLKMVMQREAQGGLRASLERMHQIPLLVGPDSMMTGEHGVASGSNWTNFIETVFDHVFSRYVYQETHTLNSFCAIGDDMCWLSTKYDDTAAEKLEQLGHSVGQDLNAEKVTNDPDKVKFLQRLFQRGYNRQDGKVRAVYSTIRALKSSVYPERFHNRKSWNSDMFCARQYMILENCVDHPLFEQFVKYVVHGQRDLIPFARKSASELDKITRETKLLPGFNPTYNQEKRDTSLANFESVQLARSY